MKKLKKRPEARNAAKRTRAFRAGALACALMLAGVATAVAKYSSQTSQPAPAAAVVAPPSTPAANYVTVEVGGKKLRVNAETLQQGPLSQEQSQQMADALEGNKSTEGLVEVQHADGTVEVDLQGHFQNVMMAKKNDDGTVSNACVDTPEAARSFLKSDADAAVSPTAGGTAAGRRAVVKK
ncbi:MAG TPA: hypothetical protein VGP08_12125 [Pyrinomonadaceae bacterium]|jgi:hypothetical protein|nr:hypothetical protein [Pyrinomonadaceae bacterium]